jgi:predicted GNAT family N-acyltransferase
MGENIGDGMCEVRLAETTEDWEAVFRLRYEVYVGERKLHPHHADHARRWLRDSLDERGKVFIAVRNGALVGTIRVNWGTEGPLECEREYCVERFRPYYPEKVTTTTKYIIAPQCRRSSVGVQLARALFTWGKDSGIAFDFINANEPLVPLYRKYGYRAYAPRFCHPEYGVVCPMVLLMDDVEHLTSVGSPLCEIAAEYPPDGESIRFFQRLLSDQQRLEASE